MSSADIPGLEAAEKIVDALWRRYLDETENTILYKKNMELGFKEDAAWECLTSIRAALAEARSEE